MTRNMLILSVATASLAIAGCAKKAPATLPPEPVGTYDDANNGDGVVTNTPVPGSQADFLARVSSDTVYFDTDRFDIDGEDRTVLQSQANWLRQYPNVSITLEGHADERGTRDYNIALGERRANAAKNYMASLGINPARISVVSYGKERPVALGSNESAWAQNRRAVTVTVN